MMKVKYETHLQFMGRYQMTKTQQPRVIYELIPFVCVLTGLFLLHGVGSIVQLGLGLLQLMVGIIIIAVRFEYRYNKTKIK